MIVNCPLCKASSLTIMASTNMPSSHKAVSCHSCGFSTGPLKPNKVVDEILERLMVTKPVPTRWVMRDNHTFLQLPDDDAEALGLILKEHAGGQMYNTLFVNGVEGIDPLHLRKSHIVTVELLASEWLKASSDALQTGLNN